MWAWEELASTYFRTGDVAGVKAVCRRHITARDRYAGSIGANIGVNRFFGSTYTYAIGHICILGFYAKLSRLEQRTGLRNRLYIDPDKVVNPSLLSYVQEDFEVTQKNYSPGSEGERFLRLEDPWLMMRSFGEWQYFYDGCIDIETRWEAESRGALLQLRHEDIENGRTQLAALGLPRDAWFVALHVRETTLGEVRNAKILDYIAAIGEITRRGGWVIRMGDPTMTRLPQMENVIDYAHSYIRSDRIDVYLIGACKFFVGTNSGPLFAPGLFGVPCLQTNFAPLMYSVPNSRDIVLPILFRLRRQERLLSFREILASPLVHAEYPKTIWGDEIEVVPNCSDEIAEAVNEMFDRLDRARPASGAASVNQERFLELCAELGLSFRTPVSERFLARHRDILG